MIIERLNIKISCDMVGCGEMADYVIRRENAGARGNFYICEACLLELKAALMIAEGEAEIVRPEKRGRKNGGRADCILGDKGDAHENGGGDSEAGKER